MYANIQQLMNAFHAVCHHFHCLYECLTFGFRGVSYVTFAVSFFSYISQQIEIYFETIILVSFEIFWLKTTAQNV